MHFKYPDDAHIQWKKEVWNIGDFMCSTVTAFIM